MSRSSLIWRDHTTSINADLFELRVPLATRIASRCL